MPMFYMHVQLYTSAGFPVSFQNYAGPVTHFEIIRTLADQLIPLSFGDSHTWLLVLMFATLSYVKMPYIDSIIWLKYIQSVFFLNCI